MAKIEPKKEKRVLLLNTLLFFLGAYDAYMQDKLTLFLVLVVTALANFFMMLFKGEYKSWLNLFVFLLNSMIAFLLARDYYLGGSNYIHFAWLAAGIVYLIATVYIYRSKTKSAQGE